MCHLFDADTNSARKRKGGRAKRRYRHFYILKLIFDIEEHYEINGVDFEVTADGARVSIFMPAELLDLIFSFLPFKTELLPSISCVNRVFRQLALSRLTPPESFRRTASPERLIQLLKFLGDHSSPRFLKHLNLSRCEALTSTELQHIPPSITSLNLSSCEYLLCSSIGCLPPNIKKVDISSCSGIYLDLGSVNLFLSFVIFYSPSTTPKLSPNCLKT